jgi:hypothetical protein
MTWQVLAVVEAVDKLSSGPGCVVGAMALGQADSLHLIIFE